MAWGSGPPGEKPDYTGLDVIIVRGDKIAALYVSSIQSRQDTTECSRWASIMKDRKALLPAVSPNELLIGRAAPTDIHLWCWGRRRGRPGSGRSRRTRASLKPLLAPYPSDEMICWSVSACLGNVKNNDPV